jgi:gluconokinase
LYLFSSLLLEHSHIVISFVCYRSDLGEENCRQLYQSTGTVIHSCYALPQLIHFYRSENEDQFHKVHQWQSLASLCLFRWIPGDNSRLWPLSYSEASWTGLINLYTCDYEPSVLELLPEPCRKALPELSDYDQVAELHHGMPPHSPYARKWPELSQSRFFLALGDGTCANIGSKCTTWNRIACTIGTSAAARMCIPLERVMSSSSDDELDSGTSKTRTVESLSSSLEIPPGLFTYRINRHYVLIGGALTDGGSIVEWFQSFLQWSDDQWNACMQQVQEQYMLHATGSSTLEHGSLTVVTNFSGERSTGYRLRASGALWGLTRETSPVDVLRGCLEGVALRLSEIIRLLHTVILDNSKNSSNPTATPSTDSQPNGDSIDDDDAVVVVVSGKALEVNETWRQMIADGSGVSVVLDDDTQAGTSRGVAIVIALALSSAERSSENLMWPVEPVREGSNNRPNKKAARYWQRAIEKHDQLLEAISPIH